MNARQRDRLALAAVVAIVVGIPFAVLSYHRLDAGGRAPDEIFVVVRTVEHGGWNPERIVVKRGTRVKLRIRADDVTHGFDLLHFGVESGPILTGTSKTVEFVPDRVGEYPFYCSVRCSSLHMGLMGTLVVEP